MIALALFLGISPQYAIPTGIIGDIALAYILFQLLGQFMIFVVCNTSQRAKHLFQAFPSSLKVISQREAMFNGQWVKFVCSSEQLRGVRPEIVYYDGNIEPRYLQWVAQSPVKPYNNGIDFTKLGQALKGV